MDPRPSLTDDLALALRLADEADRISLRAFTGGPLAFTAKADGSPVTDTDLEVESRLRAVIAAERPEDGFLGEEVGAHGSTTRRWIVDGIDGTVVFVAGHRGWGTEIALEDDGRVVVGVSTSPALGRRWWAHRGGGAWTIRTDTDRPGAPVRLAVSARAELEVGRCSSIPPLSVLDGWRRHLVETLATASAYEPPEQHSALMVAEGLVEVSVQTSGGPWDFAALAVIVEEAGGAFSDLAGAWDIHGGGPVVHSNGAVHAQALARIRAA